MLRSALILLLAGLATAAPAHGQAIYRFDPPPHGEYDGYAHRRQPSFRSKESRYRRRHDSGRAGTGRRITTPPKNGSPSCKARMPP